MDELRDYRFYASDLLHPSQEAVQYIWELFMKFAIDKTCFDRIRLIKELNNLRNHRVLFPGSEEHKKLLEKIEILEKRLV